MCRRESLYGGVCLISAIVVIFLILWTVLDPPVRQTEYEVTDSVTEEGSTIVLETYYCTSKSDAWRFAGVAWNAFDLALRYAQDRT